MTGAEVAAVLHRLAAAYRAEITETEAKVWLDHIGDLDVDPAFEATEDMIESQDGFFPTVAKFREAYNAVKRRYAARALPPADTTGPRISREKFQAGLAEMRAKLAQPKAGRS